MTRPYPHELSTSICRGKASAQEVRRNGRPGRTRGGALKQVGHGHVDRARANKDEPQYEITSDKTEDVAAHKGSALHKVD